MGSITPRGDLTRPDFGNSGATVFIVEDDEAARHALAVSLEALGCAVRTFDTCEAFLAESEQVGLGCLLLDYHFDGLSGLGLLDRLHEAKRIIPTVLFTGRFGPVLKRRAVDYAEVVAVLDKPIGGQPLIDALQRALARL